MRMSETDVASSYYDRFASDIDAVYRELGSIDDELFCPANADYQKWYRTRPGAGGEWDGTARGLVFAREFRLIKQMNPRFIHATTGYAPREWYMDAWTRYKHVDDDSGGSKKWDGPAGMDQDKRNPLPNYTDYAAYAPFVDIDLIDSELKQRRADGDLDTAPIEAAVSETIDHFAELADRRREAVHILDSVGGVYVLASPTITRPICQTVDGHDRKLLVEDLTDRINDWLRRVEQDVFDTVPEAADLIKFDIVNHKSRAYKAPLSLHADLDAVVTPIDPDDVRYEYTPVETVDDALIDASMDWASQFTADHTDAVAAVVRTLWPEYVEDADGWRDALQNRLDDLTAKREAHRRNDEIRTPTTRDGTPTGVDLDDLDVTDDIDVIHAAVESIDMFDLAEQLVVEWETAGGRSKPRFAAPWYTNHNSGQACYVIDADRFYDTVAEAGGGPLQFIAAEQGIINEPGEKITGDDYWRAVEALRNEDYHIPRFRGQNGTHKDALRVFAADEDDDDLKAMLRDVMAGK